MPTGGAYNLPGFDPTFEPAGLSGRTTALPWSTTTSGGASFSSGPGAGSSDTGGGLDWGNVLETGIPLLGSLFAPSTQNIKPEISQIEGQAASLNKQGQDLAATGQEALAPALKYFMQLANGNEADISAATAPDRARVMDQYDSARKSVQFQPRGGGQASANATIASKEASDLAVLPQAARSKAIDSLAALGTSTTNAGISAEESSTSALTSILGPIMQQAKQDQSGIASFFGGLGKFAASLIFA